MYLVLFLAEARVRLEWNKVWESNRPVELCLQIWRSADKLDAPRCSRVRCKIERFLSSTFILPTKTTRIKLPTRDPKIVREAKKQAMRIIVPVAQRDGNSIRAYLGTKLQFVAGKTADLQENVFKQIKMAQCFKYEDVEQMSE